MGRLVMLGPPNNGSEIADLLLGHKLARRLLGPSLADLGTKRKQDSILSTPSYPVGVIAGTRSIDPLGWAILPKPNDGRVSVASTRLDGAAHLTDAGQPRVDDEQFSGDRAGFGVRSNRASSCPK